MRMLHTLVWLLAVPVILFAQPAMDTLWTRVIGGAGQDIPAAIRQTSDGGYIIAGYTTSFGAQDILLTKLDSSGNTEWQRTYGDGRSDRPVDIVEVRTGGGGYAMQVYRAQHHGMACVFFLSALGDSLWFSESCHDTSITRAIPVGIVVDGTGIKSYYGAVRIENPSFYWAKWIVYYDMTGHETGSNRWQHTVSSVDENCYMWGKVKQANSGRAFVSSRDFGFQAYPFAPRRTWDYWSLACFGPQNGNQLWTFSQNTSSNTLVTAIGPSSDNGCFVATGNGDVYRFSNNGSLIWSHNNGTITDLCAVPDGNYMSLKTVSANNTDIRIQYTDATGATLWSRSYGGTVYEEAVAIEATGDGGYVILGSTTSYGAGGRDIWVIKSGPQGSQSCWIEQIQPGPPAWGYRVHWTGCPPRVELGPCCSGTTASVTGAAAGHWSTTIAFDARGFWGRFDPRDDNQAMNSTDTLWLVNPRCDGVITWRAFDSTGTTGGPIRTRAVLTVQNSQIVDSDSGIIASLSTQAESHIESFYLWRRVGDSLAYRNLGGILARGMDGHGAEYQIIDHDAPPGQNITYCWESVDSFGWRQQLSTTLSSVTRDAVWIRSFTAERIANGIALNLVTAYEAQIARYVLLRRSEVDNLYHAIASHNSFGPATHAQYYHFVDSTVVPGSEYSYYIRAVDYVNGFHEFSDRSVMAEIPIPLEYRLSAYPNPFNAEARVIFTLPERVHATVDVFSIDGRKVATLTDGDWDAGRHDLRFDGSGLSSGIYLLHLSSPHYTATQKLVLLK
jgi:hypothetical protein